MGGTLIHARAACRADPCHACRAPYRSQPQEKHYHKLDREIRSMVSMTGPYVAELFGFFSDDDNIYLVMELCEARWGWG
jgi:hypothetical protein